MASILTRTVSDIEDYSTCFCVYLAIVILAKQLIAAIPVEI